MLQSGHTFPPQLSPCHLLQQIPATPFQMAGNLTERLKFDLALFEDLQNPVWFVSLK